MLDQEEWRQIEYLLWITQPFFKFTTALSETKDVTIHLIFSIYNKLFDHLEKSIRQLQRKKVPWKTLMLSALHAAKEKLSYYYRKTDEIPGDLFAISTILAPQHKLQFFTSKDWGNDSHSWRDRYRQSFEDYLRPYQQRLSKDRSTSQTQVSTGLSSEFKIEMLLAPTESCQSTQRDELTQYLESGM